MRLPVHSTRKDLAGILGANFNARWLRMNEKRLGLEAARVKFVRRPVVYKTTVALVILTRAGFDCSGALD